MTDDPTHLEHPTRPLFQQRGNNPPRLIGYECTEHGEVFTANMNLSNNQKYVETNPGFQGRFLDNRRHRLRIKAAKTKRGITKRKDKKDATSE